MSAEITTLPLDVRMTDMQLEALHKESFDHHAMRDIPTATAELDTPTTFKGQLFIDGDTVTPGKTEVKAFNYDEMTARIAGSLASGRAFEASVRYYFPSKDHKNSQLVSATITK